MEQRWFNEEEWLAKWKTGTKAVQGPYLGFYSSLVDGFFREPWGFWVPVDDHIVHRGDGVFEAVRIASHAFFDLESHLARLGRSAEKIFLNLPFSIPEIRERCLALGALAQAKEGVLRLYVSRGPGGFSQNPYESKHSQLYMAITPWKAPSDQWYTEGVRAGVSHVLGKRPSEATIKSCNYLQNVLQKKDAVDRGLDFSVCLDDDGHVLEGSTESFCVVNAKNEMLIPSTQITLNGTTLNVVRKLATQMVEEGQLKSVSETKFFVGDISTANEVAFVGTTIGVCPVTRWETDLIGDGQVGPIMKELGKRLHQVIHNDPSFRSTF